MRGIERRQIFHDDRDRADFVARLARVLPECGAVCFAWALRDPEICCVQTLESHFDGDRESVRIQAVNLALRGLLEINR